MSDVVFIRGLRAETVIGIYEWEKTITQPVILDLEMALDLQLAATTDSIDHTLDYKAVAKRLKQFITESRCELVETLAERCAQLILNEFNIAWVRLTLNKVGALSDAQDVGVIIERRRD
jgi:dihydroneopterin aldolase